MEVAPGAEVEEKEGKRAGVEGARREAAQPQVAEEERDEQGRHLRAIPPAPADAEELVRALLASLLALLAMLQQEGTRRGHAVGCRLAAFVKLEEHAAVPRVQLRRILVLERKGEFQHHRVRGFRDHLGRLGREVYHPKSRLGRLLEEHALAAERAVRRDAHCKRKNHTKPDAVKQCNGASMRPSRARSVSQ